MSGSSFFQGKRVLVTGAGGFIGSHLAESLVRAGARVRALLHYRATDPMGNLALAAGDVRDGMELVYGDITDAECARAGTRGVEVVFHLAALIDIPYSYQAPLSYVRANVEGTTQMLVAAREAGVSRFVHTSTSECYGTAQYTPIDEKHPLVGQSPYAASKIAADKLAESFHRSYDLPVVTVRPFNTYGPRQSQRAIVPTIIAQALSNAASIHLGDLRPTRDLTYVDDTVSGFQALAACDAALGGAFNLGTGEGVTIGDLAQRILAATGRDKPIVSRDPERLRPESSEVYALISDHRRCRELTGWRPMVKLDEGLRRTISFFT